MKTGRLLLAYIAYFIEIFSAVVVSRRYISSPNVEIGFEVVLIIGILTSCLLLPLEEYSLAQDHSGGGATLLSWQQSVDSFDYHKLQSFDSVAYQRDISDA